MKKQTWILATSLAFLLGCIVLYQSHEYSAEPAIPRKGLRITSSGDLSIIQENPGEIILTAETRERHSRIEWDVEGPGEGFVTVNVRQEGNISFVAIQLKRPSPAEWLDDTYIFVKASLENRPKNQRTTDSRQVNLRKFRRSGQTSAGSAPVCIDIPRTEGPIGFVWTQRGSQSNEAQEFVHSNVTAKKDNDFVEKHTDSDSQKVDLHVRYRSDQDVGRGTFSLREEIKFSGSLEIDAIYQGSKVWGASHNASIGIAAGVSAGIDNSQVLLQDNTAGVRYKGFPETVSLGISIEGNERHIVSGYAGIGVSLTLVEQDRLSVKRSPNGTHILESKGNHNPGQVVQFNKLISIASGISLEQLNDNEWAMQASASLGIRMPENEVLQLCFSPEI